MPNLTEREKQWIVRRLAQFASAQEIAHEARAQGINADPVEIAGLDPTRFFIGPALLALYRAVRTEYLESFTPETMRRKSRIVILDRVANEAMHRGATSTLIAALSQIRDEMQSVPDPDSPVTSGAPAEVHVIHEIIDPAPPPPEYA